MKKETVNLFFACDVRYLPLFGVALASLKENRDQARSYRVYLLHTDISKDERDAMCARFNEPGFSLTFRNVSREIAHFVERLHTRDYYSNATYYRLLIPELYPRMKKALYLDCDILLRGDVSRLFDTDLTGLLAGAVPDGFVNFVPVLRKYVENRVGVAKDVPYFNAGVLLMNLEEMRREAFGEKFLSLLSTVKFRVAQDQDYLNVLCAGRVRFLSDTWNYMPFQPAAQEPMLVHFNLDSKPWQKDGVLYADEFWACADATPYGKTLHEKRRAYTEEDARRAAEQTEKLIATAVEESEDSEENRRIQGRIRRALKWGTPRIEKREVSRSPLPYKGNMLTRRAL